MWIILFATAIQELIQEFVFSRYRDHSKMDDVGVASGASTHTTSRWILTTRWERGQCRFLCIRCPRRSQGPWALTTCHQRTCRAPRKKSSVRSVPLCSPKSCLPDSCLCCLKKKKKAQAYRTLFPTAAPSPPLRVLPAASALSASI